MPISNPASVLVRVSLEGRYLWLLYVEEVRILELNEGGCITVY